MQACDANRRRRTHPPLEPVGAAAATYMVSSQGASARPMRHLIPRLVGFDVVARQGTEVTEVRPARWIVCHDPRMSMSHTPLEGPMYVTLGRNGEPALGFTWRIWASRTSFYLKSRAPHMQHLKLSLHSNDPRHPSGGGFKMAMDPEEKFEQDLADGKIAAQGMAYGRCGSRESRSTPMRRSSHVSAGRGMPAIASAPHRRPEVSRGTQPASRLRRHLSRATPLTST